MKHSKLSTASLKRVLPIPSLEVPFLGPHLIVSKERRAWIRLASHTVVFDRDTDFARYSKDPSGSVVRILHLWLAEAGERLPIIRHYLGSVRRYAGNGWVSRRELARLFRRTTVAAHLVGESARDLRRCLSRYLREYFTQKFEPDP